MNDKLERTTEYWFDDYTDPPLAQRAHSTIFTDDGSDGILCSEIKRSSSENIDGPTLIHSEELGKTEKTAHKEIFRPLFNDFDFGISMVGIKYRNGLEGVIKREEIKKEMTVYGQNVFNKYIEDEVEVNKVINHESYIINEDNSWYLQRIYNRIIRESVETPKSHETVQQDEILSPGQDEIHGITGDKRIEPNGNSLDQRVENIEEIDQIYNQERMGDQCDTLETDLCEEIKIEEIQIKEIKDTKDPSVLDAKQVAQVDEENNIVISHIVSDAFETDSHKTITNEVDNKHATKLDIALEVTSEYLTNIEKSIDTNDANVENEDFQDNNTVKNQNHVVEMDQNKSYDANHTVIIDEKDCTLENSPKVESKGRSEWKKGTMSLAKAPLGDRWRLLNYVVCNWCKRTFCPRALDVHLRGCSKRNNPTFNSHSNKPIKPKTNELKIESISNTQPCNSSKINHGLLAAAHLYRYPADRKLDIKYSSTEQDKIESSVKTFASHSTDDKNKIVKGMDRNQQYDQDKMRGGCNSTKGARIFCLGNSKKGKDYAHELNSNHGKNEMGIQGLSIDSHSKLLRINDNVESKYYDSNLNNAKKGSKIIPSDGGQTNGEFQSNKPGFHSGDILDENQLFNLWTKFGRNKQNRSTVVQDLRAFSGKCQWEKSQKMNFNSAFAETYWL